MAGPGPSVGVLAVMVNFRLAEHIERVLASGALAGCAVLLIDNASEPERIVAIAERHGAQTLLNAENVGFAAAINSAAERFPSYGDVLLLNPDVELDALALQQLLAYRRDHHLDAAAPLLQDERGVLQVGSAGGPITLRSVATYFLFLSHLLPSVEGFFLTRRQLRAQIAPRWLCMAAMVIRGDALQRWGPLPEDELVYAEDVAWGARASLAGARLGLARQITVVHRRGASGGSQRWVAATERLLERQLGGLRGPLAIAAFRVGLQIRRALGRRLQ